MDLGQVFTRDIVAKYMVSQLTVSKSAKVLDPCFGKGVFLDMLNKVGYTNVEGYELDAALYRNVIDKFPDYSLFQGNFLENKNSGKYDAIIMNPPYIRQEKIDELNPLGITKDAIRKMHLFQDLPSTANMYMYFIVNALDLLKNEGELVVIFPGSWLNTKAGKNFENLICSIAGIEKKIYLSGNAFETNALVDVIILKMIRGKKIKDENIEYLKITDDSIEINNTVGQFEKIDFQVSFSRYASIRRGLTTGCNKMFINPKISEIDQFCVPIISGPKSILGYGTDEAVLDNILDINDKSLSKEMEEYLSLWEKQIMISHAPKTLYEKILNKKCWYGISMIDCKGILFSYFVRNDMKFVLNDRGILARDNFYIIYPEIDKYLMFSLLNNYYTYYQLEYIGKKYGAGLLKIQKYDIESLCFPNINILTNRDKYLLVEIAKEMINTGINRTQDITRVFSSYSSWSLDKIMSKYNRIKKARLEEA